MNNAAFDEFAETLSRFLPPGLDALKSDFERNARIALQTVLTKMDLVTREDFDIQSRLLERTRERLSTLESRVLELEKLAGVVGPGEEITDPAE
ncbi:MAG: accessory factor UbiK family protein [Pseudomonadota bacterium]